MIKPNVQPDLFNNASESQAEKSFEKNYFIEILLPLPFSKTYHYLVPKSLYLQTGQLVKVSFGPRLLTGCVWAIPEDQQTLFKTSNLAKMKYVEGRIDVLAFTKKHLAFLHWVASYTMSPLGALLKMALSGADLNYKPKPILSYFYHPDFIGKLTSRQKTIIAYLKDHPSQSSKTLCNTLKTTGATLKKLLGLGAIFLKEGEVSKKILGLSNLGFTLTEEQKIASETLLEAIDVGKHQTLFLDGVTGSGKTEVYFRAIHHALSSAKQSLVLLPEIALSAQWIKRFKENFGFEPAVWHSHISLSKKRTLWQEIANGSCPVIIGARSSLFLPFKKLGFIIIDEEHEGAYKQEEGTLYHARDMGIVRGHLEEVPVLLVSATPSLETYYNVKNHKYQSLELTKRFGKASLPTINIVDLLKEKMPPREWISVPLRLALQATLAQKEQAILFLNRRGYSPLMLCRGCGHRMKCAHCSAWMIWHKITGRLHCHHCEAQQLIPETCPKCDGQGLFAFCGPGVERVAEEAHKLFPDARILYMTSDHMGKAGAIKTAVDRILNHEIDIIVGTQMIAKGHHFPNLTLVGVIDADLGLAGADPRATEKTYHLLHQVSGRAGREGKAGHVYVQTTLPDHPLIHALKNYDRDGFLDFELENREKGELPPFSKLAALIISAEREDYLLQFCYQLMRSLPEHFLKDDQFDVLGPAPAPIAFLRGRYRQRFLIKAPKNFNLQPLIQNWLNALKCPKDIKIAVDIDPYSFL